MSPSEFSGSEIIRGRLVVSYKQFDGWTISFVYPIKSLPDGEVYYDRLESICDSDSCQFVDYTEISFYKNPPLKREI